MATVQQVHRYLSNQALGNIARQKELQEAVQELTLKFQKLENSRKKSGTPLPRSPTLVAQPRVTKRDRLYKLYIEALKVVPHQFERKLGDLRCVIHTNTTLEDADLIVIFLHGLGASPWHFYKIAPAFLEESLLSNQPYKVAHIFPFAPYKMDGNDFGAIEDCVYGSYKWWDVFLRDEVPFTSPLTTSREKGFLTGASFAMPTVIREAQPSPRVWGDTDDLDRGGMFYRNNESTLLARGTSKMLKTPNASWQQGSTGGSRMTTTPLEWLEEEDESPCPATPDQRNGLCCNCAAKRSTSSTEYNEDLKISFENPRGREDARQKVELLITTLKQKFRVPADKIGLAGFSQGAMLALDVFHRGEEPPAFLGIFSGAPMCADEWKKSLASKADPAKFKRCRVVQTHGKSDWIFPPFVGRWLNRFLVREGLNVQEFLEFDGEHELPNVSVTLLNKTIFQCITKRYNDDDNTACGGGGSTISARFDDLAYKLGYAFASCLLPIAKRVY